MVDSSGRIRWSAPGAVQRSHSLCGDHVIGDTYGSSMNSSIPLNGKKKRKGGHAQKTKSEPLSGQNTHYDGRNDTAQKGNNNPVVKAALPSASLPKPSYTERIILFQISDGGFANVMYGLISSYVIAALTNSTLICGAFVAFLCIVENRYNFDSVFTILDMQGREVKKESIYWDSRLTCRSGKVLRLVPAERGKQLFPEAISLGSGSSEHDRFRLLHPPVHHSLHELPLVLVDALEQGNIPASGRFRAA